MAMSFSGGWIGAHPQMQQLLATTGNLMNTPQQYFPGSTVAGLPPHLLQGLQSTWDAAGGMQQQIGQAQNAWANALNTDVRSDPAVRGMLRANKRAVNKNLTENVLPALNMGRQQIGGMENTRGDLAAGVAGGQASEALANANAGTLNSAWQTAMNSRDRALGLSGQMANLNMLPAQAQMRVGEFMRQHQQQLIDAAKARHDFGQMESWRRAMMAQGIIQPAFSSGETKMAPSQDRGGSGMGGLLGGALALGGSFLGGPAGGMIASQIPGLFGGDNYGIGSGPSAMMNPGAGWWNRRG